MIGDSRLRTFELLHRVFVIIAINAEISQKVQIECMSIISSGQKQGGEILQQMHPYSLNTGGRLLTFELLIQHIVLVITGLIIEMPHRVYIRYVFRHLKQ